MLKTFRVICNLDGDNIWDKYTKSSWEEVTMVLQDEGFKFDCYSNLGRKYTKINCESIVIYVEDLEKLIVPVKKLIDKHHST